MILTLPSGESIANPTFYNIYELLGKNIEYWRNGDVTLETGNIYLQIIRDEKYGYFVLNLNDFKAPLGDEKDKNLLLVDDMGGDPFLVPLCCYLTYSQVELILLYFIKHKELFDYEKWYDIYEGQDEGFIDNELYTKCIFGEILKIENGKVVKL